MRRQPSSRPRRTPWSVSSSWSSASSPQSRSDCWSVDMATSEPVAGAHRGNGSDPIVSFDKVVKQFGNLTVLRDLDFNVAPGERVTLIGPSGSGKTTILRLLMTLEKVTSGSITVD